MGGLFWRSFVSQVTKTCDGTAQITEDSACPQANANASPAFK
jgi:hypothetical protein